MTSESYDVIPYRGTAVPLTAPDHLALCAMWHRGIRPRTAGARVMEVGCGDGANLLPLAFYDPSSTFIGVDGCRAHIDEACHGAARLRLKNIQFVRQDIRDLQPQHYGPLDFVIAHGVYSWVAEDVRHALLNFCHRSLAAEGLAYVSYNAQPGWATRRLVREALLRSRTVREAAPEDKPQRAIEVANELLKDLPGRDYAFGTLLASELERVRDGKDFYVCHEYLAEINEGFWFRDFVEEAQRHGLDYVGDAQFCRWEGHVPDGLARTVSRRYPGIVEQEEATDLLGNRYFRASILCRADAARAPVGHTDILDTAYIATSLAAQSDPFDLTDGVVERFSRDGGPEITLDTAITKAAIVLLATQWPTGATLEDVFRRSARLLSGHVQEVAANARFQLSEELTTLFRAGQLDLRLRPPAAHRTDGDPLTANRLARYEADCQKALTTRYHLGLPLPADALRLVSCLDGSQPRASLQEQFDGDTVERTLLTLRRWGLLDDPHERLNHLSEAVRTQALAPGHTESHRWP